MGGAIPGLHTFGWHSLNVAPPPGGFGSVEPAAALPWALNLAQNWRPDARLTLIYADRVRPDGTINLKDDAKASLEYRFASPSLLEERRKQEQQGVSEVQDGYRVRLENGKMRALVEQNSWEKGPVPGYPKLTHLSSELAQKSLPARPFYSAYFNAGNQRWYISVPGGAN